MGQVQSPFEIWSVIPCACDLTALSWENVVAVNRWIVTIEDAAELQLQQEHVLRMETKVANTDGTGAVTIRDLVRNSLRMRPDRIIVGECRGGESLDRYDRRRCGIAVATGTRLAHGNESCKYRWDR